MNIFHKNKVLTSRNNTSTSLVTKTVKVTIGHPAATGVDQVFTSAANKSEQSLQLTEAAMIPAYARIEYVLAFCTENFTGSAGDETGFSCDMGLSAGSNEMFAAGNIDDVNDQKQGLPSILAVSIVSTAQSIYLNATPTVNDWNQLTAGKLSVWITYIDNNVL